MAFSPLSLTSPSPSTSALSSQLSLHFLTFHPTKTHSFKSFRAQKLRISCCQQTVQFENETLHHETPLKKKRKPRPSFLQKIQDKWSLKTPSQRVIFPWQEEGIGGGNQEFQGQRAESSKDISSETENESMAYSVSPVVKIKSTSAPWSHGGNESRRNLLNSESAITLRKQDHENEKASVSGVFQEYENSVAEVIPEEKSEEKCIEDVSIVPIGFSDENGSWDDGEGSDGYNFLEDTPTVCRNVEGVERSLLMRLPWETVVDEEFEKGEKSRKSKTELAEKSIPESELKRLRNVALRMVERIKVGAAGVTQALVDAIHDKWRDEEVVKLKFEGPPSENMKRMHEILESRTGGLVIWRSGSLVVLYRGMAYKLDCVKSYTENIQSDVGASGPSMNLIQDFPREKHMNAPNHLDNLSKEEQLDLSELNLLLDELGPRFRDWSGREPLPVDADLLPAIVPGYKTPFRQLPYGTRLTLQNNEMTYLRRTARMQPPHFALGRNRELQGLAMAMVKLWGKSAIAKIAIKRGVQNTSNERMAEELKILTGGTLVSRNKDFIVFYRGNDFLPPGLSSTLAEAEDSAAARQDEEEQARIRAAALIDPNSKALKQPLVAGTLAETVAATSRWSNKPNNAELQNIIRETTVAKHASLINFLEKKLAHAKGKIKKAENTLMKVHENKKPADLPTDLETLSDEERCLFRRIGLSLKSYLLLGRRQIFDGTIENMHLHWKHRELVKIIVPRKAFPQVKHIAVSLEAESGGVLVSIDQTTKGYAIIVYRGKNYQRPTVFRPKSLLTKRQALARSIELQRREALKHHVLELEDKIEKLKHELEEMKEADENEEADD